jgi:hypothetical protein
MARIRTIKPDFFFDEKITELDHKARLAFIGLWCYADKEGKMEDKPKVLKAKLFPYENIDFDKILTALADVNMISRYVVEGKNFLIINNFQKHQRPHHTEKKSEIPDFNGIITVKDPLQDGEEKVGKEGKGKEGKGVYVTFFKEFWDIAPERNGKKLGKGEAEIKFNKLKEEDLPLILQSIKNYAISKNVKQGIGIKDPHRFISCKDNPEYWKEWIEGENITTKKDPDAWMRPGSGITGIYE